MLNSHIGNSEKVFAHTHPTRTSILQGKPTMGKESPSYDELCAMTTLGDGEHSVREAIEQLGKETESLGSHVVSTFRPVRGREENVCEQALLSPHI